MTHRPRRRFRAVAKAAITAFCVAFSLFVAPTPAQAIYGGTDANLSEFPFMVSLQYRVDGKWFAQCGATLVSDRWVLTAAHCVENDGEIISADDLRVVIAENPVGDSWAESSMRTVGTPVLYNDGKQATPNYLRPGSRVDGDAALVPLPVPVPNSPVVKLSYGEMPVGTAMTAVGWGATADYGMTFGQHADRLQKLDDVIVRADSDCFDKMSSDIDSKSAADYEICTKADRHWLTLGGPRHGDSGGPLLYWSKGHWLQMGIASFLPHAGCGDRSASCQIFGSWVDGDPNYTAWTSIKRVRSWVTSTIDTRPPGSQGQVATALIIDSSGSMSSNDPQDRRKDAARAYLTASRDDDQVGVVDFDSEARVLAEAAAVDANRDRLQEAIAGIDSDGGTDLGAGLQTGCDVLTRAAATQRAAIFLTDGDGSYSGQAQCFAAHGWPVFTIGLGSGVSDSVLKEIAGATGGRYLPLAEATNLVCEFQQVRASIAGIPASSCDPSATIKLDQTIVTAKNVAEDLQQITFTNTWLGSDIKMTVTSPSGKSYDRSTTAEGATISYGRTFESFTINRPEAGTWQVKFYGADIPEGGEPYTFSTVELPLPDDQIDSDDDGLSDPVDNCAYVANRDQADLDGNDVGDACDAGLVRGDDLGAGGGPAPMNAGPSWATGTLVLRGPDAALRWRQRPADNGYELRWRTAGLRSAFGPWHSFAWPKDNTTRSPRLVGARSALVQVRAIDVNGAFSAWSAPLRLVAVADDAALHRTGRWTTAPHRRHAVAGTLSTVRQRGARMTLGWAGSGQVVALLKTTRSGGTVAIMRGHTVLRRVHLKAARPGIRTIVLPPSSAGRVWLKTVSAGRVGVDGLGVLRR